MSKLEQMKTREATHALSTRVDARYLATLMLFWRDQQCLPTSISELTRLSLESFAEFLVSNGMVEFVETHEAALEIMEGLGMNPKRVNPKYLAQAILKSSANVNLDFLNSPTVDHKHKLIMKETAGVSSIDVSRVISVMQESESLSAEDRVREAQKRAEEFTRSLGEIPTEISPVDDEE
jgi:hypothetical protein